jgi:hypothetical protein
MKKQHYKLDGKFVTVFNNFQYCHGASVKSVAEATSTALANYNNVYEFTAAYLKHLVKDKGYFMYKCHYVKIVEPNKPINNESKIRYDGADMTLGALLGG